MLQTLKLPYGKITLIEKIEDGHFESPSGCYDNLPRICRVVVDASVEEGSKIRVEVWLPEEWNGIFIGHANGGIAGRVMHHNLEPYVTRGYAIAQSDLGSSDGLKRGPLNPALWKDYGGRANIVMTKIGKAIVSDYYGRTPEYSYFMGASTGGQQAHSVAQRYPEEYDGIVGGVPANNRVFLHTYMLWNALNLCPDGEPLFNQEDATRLADLGAAFFQSKGDGEKGDNFITFPYIGRQTTEEFLGYLKAEGVGFSEAQINALRAVYNGPINPVTGEQIYCGLPIGSEIFCGPMMTAGPRKEPHNYVLSWAFGEDYDIGSFDFGKDLDALVEIIAKELNANQPDLSAFRAHGGKFITYSGVADAVVPYPDAIKYYNRVCEKMGGYDEVKDFFRYFLFPGKEHGDRGRGTNTIWTDEDGHCILDALRLWREEGKAPEYMIAAHVEDKTGLGVPCVGIDADMKKALPQTTFMRKIYPYQANWKEGEDFPLCCSDRYLNFGL